MKSEEHTNKTIEYLTITTKTAIADERQYQITQAELDRFEHELEKVDRKDPSLHPRLILGRINSFQRTIDRLKQELMTYEQNNGSKID
jgi:hypothetical protein